MNRQDIKKALDELTGDIDSIADKKVVGIIKTLVNLVEILADANEQLKATNQQLKDEINHLKGEQGKPNIRKQTKDGDNDRGNSDHSSEKNRNKGKGDKKKKHKNKKTETVRIDRKVTVEFDKTILPDDATFKGYDHGAGIIKTIR